MTPSREAQTRRGVPLGTIVLALVAIQAAVVVVFAWKLLPGLF